MKTKLKLTIIFVSTLLLTTGCIPEMKTASIQRESKYTKELEQTLGGVIIPPKPENSTNEITSGLMTYNINPYENLYIEEIKIGENKEELITHLSIFTQGDDYHKQFVEINKALETFGLELSKDEINKEIENLKVNNINPYWREIENKDYLVERTDENLSIHFKFKKNIKRQPADALLEKWNLSKFSELGFVPLETNRTLEETYSKIYKYKKRYPYSNLKESATLTLKPNGGVQLDVNLNLKPSGEFLEDVSKMISTIEPTIEYTSLGLKRRLEHIKETGENVRVLDDYILTINQPTDKQGYSITLSK